jgi:hypothetical protein
VALLSVEVLDTVVLVWNPIWTRRGCLELSELLLVLLPILSSLVGGSKGSGTDSGSVSLASSGKDYHNHVTAGHDK